MCGGNKGGVLRMLMSSLSSVNSLNSPSETPSEYFVEHAHAKHVDWVTYPDRTRFASEAAPWTLCTSGTGAGIYPGRHPRSCEEQRGRRTTHIFSRSSMTSCGVDCTLIRAAYCTAFLSILPTTEVNDGRPRFSFPGGGCVMSPPITIVGFAGSERNEASRGSGMAFVPPSLTLIL